MNSSRSNPAVRLAPEGARATSTSAPLIAALIEMPARTPETGITYPNAVDGWRWLYRQRHERGLAAAFLQQGVHVARHWWEAGNHPRRSKTTIAKRSVTPGPVRRSVRKMEEAGLINRRYRETESRGNLPNMYDFGGLIEKATPFAKDFLAGKERVSVNMRPALDAGARNSRL